MEVAKAAAMTEAVRLNAVLTRIRPASSCSLSDFEQVKSERGCDADRSSVPCGALSANSAREQR